ncbi:MAG TPA: hypothetical protein VNU71_08100 [Burkholderiaceae bacterium]|nr:hypothetical protein [Burkholderiaceae bacterium]
MDLDKGMAETVAPQLPTPAQIAACRWLPDAELAVYAAEFARTGLQGGLQWYRCQTEGHRNADTRLFAGRRIEVPACFIAGRADWARGNGPARCSACRPRPARASRAATGSKAPATGCSRSSPRRWCSN